MRYAVLFWLLLPSFLGLCQKLITPSNPVYQPYFESKADSIAYSKLEKATFGIMNRPDRDVKKSDSLIKLQQDLRAKMKFRKTYLPNPNFTSWDDVKKSGEYESVTRLSISNLKAKDLPGEILKCKNLESLELVNTSVTRIPRSFSHLKGFRYLLIYNNQIKSPLKIKRNNSLTTLIVRGGNQPKKIKKLRGLEKLDLSSCNLTKFPDNLGRNKKLKELLLNNNSISLTENKIRPYLSLISLELQGNKIEVVPDEIERLTNLRKILFNGNSIRKVSPSISKLQNLEQLSFYINQLTEIPDGIYELKSLKEIDLYYNQIEKVSEKIENLQRLEILYLAFNKVYSLSENLGHLKNLHELYLHNNRLSSLPESIGSLSNLKVLRVNNNYLSQLPASLKKLNELENLDVSRNEIRNLPTDFLDLQHLELVVLLGNPWDNETKEHLQEKAKELRAKEVIVHLNSFDESVED